MPCCQGDGHHAGRGLFLVPHFLVHHSVAMAPDFWQRGDACSNAQKNPNGPTQLGLPLN